MECFYKAFMEREQITGMVFDVDGTLLDSMPVWDHSGERYLATIGIDAPLSLGKVLFSLTMQQGAQYIKKTYDLNQTEEEIRSGILRVVENAYKNEVLLKPSVADFLKALKEAGIPMVVATSTDRPLVLAALERTGIRPYFQDILTCSEFGSGKDQPEIFHAAAAKMGSEEKHTWVVEDALYAIRTAKAAGYRIIGVSDASSQKEEMEIRRLADYYVSNFGASFDETAKGQG